MTSSEHRPPTLPEYLIEQDFVPQAEGTWYDRDTGQQTIRVTWEPGEETQLIALAPHSACLYKATFSPGTPHAVIIAAVQAALGLPRPSRARRKSGNKKGTGDPR